MVFRKPNSRSLEEEKRRKLAEADEGGFANQTNPSTPGQLFGQPHDGGRLGTRPRGDFWAPPGGFKPRGQPDDPVPALGFFAGKGVSLQPRGFNERLATTEGFGGLERGIAGGSRPGKKFGRPDVRGFLDPNTPEGQQRAFGQAGGTLLSGRIRRSKRSAGGTLLAGERAFLG